MGEVEHEHPRAEADRGRTMRESLAAQAAIRPDAPAILSPRGPDVAAGALVRRIDDIGDLLRRSGLGRSDRIAVVAGLGPEDAIAVLGVASWATCIPVNPSAPAELDAVLAETGARAVLAPHGATTAERAAARRSGASLLDGLPPEPAGGQAAIGRSSEPAAADDVALVLRTSGTTSRPKLVPATHRQLSARVDAASEFMRLGIDDRCLSPMPLCYGHGLYTGLLIPVLAGGSAVLPSRFDEETFMECLTSLGPTWYTAGPAHQQAILGWLRERRTEIEGHGMRFARCASGSLPPEVREGLESLLGVPVLETYGTSEAGMIASPNPFGRRKAGTAGVATGVEVAVVDEDGAPVPPGSQGEIVVRGPTVFSGYEGDPELNERTFVEGWLRTGDRGTLDLDGFLTVGGRLDEVINRGGEKVSPTEVESALMEHPAVTGAVAFGVPHETLGQEIAAAVTLAAEAAASEADLRSHLGDRVAPFKVPRRLAVLPELPVGPTGKPLRAHMAERLGWEAQREDRTEPRPDPGPLALRLAALWGEVLERSVVGADDDFFDCGGDSLSGIELLTAIDEELDVELGLDDLVEAPTPRALARRIMDDSGLDPRASRPGPDLPGVNTKGRNPPLFAVAGRSGSVLRMLLVGRAIGEQQPVYGLEPPGMDWAAAGIRTLPEMAAHYLTEVRALQPRGPYRLLGSSFGGLVVFEMARQLEQEDEEVGFLGMIDAEPAPFGWRPDADGMPPRTLEKIDRVPRSAGADAGDAIPAAGARVAAAQTDAGLDYVIENRVRCTPTLLYCAGEGVPAGGDRRGLWAEATTGGLRLLALPGLHARIHQEPQFSALTGALRSCLSENPPPGLDPAEVFGRTYSLERQPGAEVIRDDAGSLFRVEKGAMRGRVRGIRRTRGKLLVRGWASDPDRKRPGETVVAFVDGSYAGYSTCGVPAERLARRHPALGHAGFRMRLGRVPENGAIPTPRVFALGPDGRASELASG